MILRFGAVEEVVKVNQSLSLLVEMLAFISVLSGIVLDALRDSFAS